MTHPPDGPYGYGYSEPTPWATGIALIVIVAALTAAGVYAFGAALAQIHPLLAVVVNLIAVGGATPTAWRWRYAPVTRWVIFGLAAGVLLGWVALLAGATPDKSSVALGHSILAAQPAQQAAALAIVFDGGL
ncbi:DUF2537 domain-containing protein [Nocardia sp. NPDC051030]|uniref:DUF2537 domain-containing protein n=1 Tax=Nocardia sp. NPDC051030 TaxID=3155162 RepID=UPI003445D0FA